jgi:hypothetical protein
MMLAWWRKWRRQRFERHARNTFALVYLVLQADQNARKAMRRVLRTNDAK